MDCAIQKMPGFDIVHSHKYFPKLPLSIQRSHIAVRIIFTNTSLQGCNDDSLEENMQILILVLLVMLVFGGGGYYGYHGGYYGGGGLGIIGIILIVLVVGAVLGRSRIGF